MLKYVDVHTHLTHEKFSKDQEIVIERAIASGLEAIVVNGLEPGSNREILRLAEKFRVIKPALGIYPVNAVIHLLGTEFPFKVSPFNVDDEINFIRECAASRKIIAVGECGLDGYWLDEKTFSEQERVFGLLIDIAMKFELPLIIHTRKLETRAHDILKERGARKVNFHCFGGRTKLAKQWAEDQGWYFSIPANANKNEAFKKMLKTLPFDRILTETDAPYLAPLKGERNEPRNVVGTIELLAKFRDMKIEEAMDQVWQNYQRLFCSNETLKC